MIKRWITALVIGTGVLFFPVNQTVAQQILPTRQAVVYYDRAADLREMEQRLHFAPGGNAGPNRLSTPDRLPDPMAPTLAGKIDGLLARVCLLLHCRPQPGQPLRIFLLRDGRQVRQRQLALQPFGPPEPSFFSHAPGSLEGFYEPRTRTIFLSLADLRDGILAHEMAHFVLCTSVTPAPPPDWQEAWARYVESSLD